MPPGVILCAQKIRYRLENIEFDLVRHKRSRYNHEVIVDACAQCGKPADEVHHRRPQASADEDGFVGHFHKNIKHNLVALCAACHDLQHKQQRMDVV